MPDYFPRKRISYPKNKLAVHQTVMSRAILGVKLLKKT
jgi:hypothetical protein